ncbi:glycosyltransferase family 4 protein [Aerococcaceae bacterium DSM 111020]|nr:glycosyltransferase family 4 protein [Aerococcaceae bacterium DSM 111020]
MGIYNFRKELVLKLIDEGYNVIISSPYGKRIDKLIEMGCVFEEVQLNRHGKSIVEDYNLMQSYKTLFKKYKPEVALGFTIKPNIYGAFVAERQNIPFIANITGIGSALMKEGPLRYFTLMLYKLAFKKVQKVLFQNEYNLNFFKRYGIIKNNYSLLPGSGVNLEEYSLLPYPEEEKIHFAFISRIMKDKGIEEYIQLAKHFHQASENTHFHVYGFCEEDYEEELNQLTREGILTYHGMAQNVHHELKKLHCIVHPSYHEGLSNVLLEAAASGRPVIASDIPGCRETFDDGVSGLGFEVRNMEQLIAQVHRFLDLSHEEKVQMGLAGRAKVEQEFSRELVTNLYLKEIKNIGGKG